MLFCRARLKWFYVFLMISQISILLKAYYLRSVNYIIYKIVREYGA